MRVLFHDAFRKDGSPSSISLLTLLSMRVTTMLATPRTKFADWRCFLSERIDPKSATAPTALLPKLGDTLTKVSFATWWESDSVANDNGVAVSRRRIVLGAANKDGGAHVDPKLDRFYRNLAQGEYAIGITRSPEPPGTPDAEPVYPKNGHLALLRQFAHEVISTAQEFDWRATAS